MFICERADCRNFSWFRKECKRHREDTRIASRIPIYPPIPLPSKPLDPWPEFPKGSRIKLGPKPSYHTSKTSRVIKERDPISYDSGPSIYDSGPSTLLDAIVSIADSVSDSSDPVTASMPSFSDVSSGASTFDAGGGDFGGGGASSDW